MTKVPVQLKSYVGRMFELKKYTSIPGSAKARSNWYNNPSTKLSYRDFSDLVLVLDEGTTKVMVQKKDGFPVWIGKFYLRTEIQGEGKTQAEFGCENVLMTLKTLLSKVNSQLTEKEKLDASRSVDTLLGWLEEEKTRTSPST